MGQALPKINVPSSAAAYDAALEGLVRLDEMILKQRPDLPPLYKSGAKYSSRPHDVWRHADDVAREKWGDCEDLAAYRAAELRVSGEDPAAKLVTYKTGPHKYHAVVQRGSGVIEDPSKVLGMPIKDTAAYEGKLAMAFGRENIMPSATVHGAQMVIGEDPAPGVRTLSFDVYHTGRGWAGVIRLPIDISPELPSGKAILMQTSDSKTPTEAAKKASNMAKLIDALPPDLKSKIPPGAQQAAAVLTNPTVVKALQNPASLANMTTMLARPDIALQNLEKVGSELKKLKFW